ncbi:MAG: hypothetical protein QW478_01195 [Candidatus Micrarchaeaceae archaeon]
MDVLGYDCIKEIFYYSDHKDLIHWRLVNKKFRDIIDNLQFPDVDLITACQNKQYLVIKRYINVTDYKITLKYALTCLYINFNIDFFIFFVELIFKLKSYNINDLTFNDHNLFFLTKNISYILTEENKDINLEFLLYYIELFEIQRKSDSIFLTILFIVYEQILRTLYVKDKIEIEKIYKLVSVFDHQRYEKLKYKNFVISEFLNCINNKYKYPYYLILSVIKYYYGKSFTDYELNHKILDIISTVTKYF